MALILNAAAISHVSFRITEKVFEMVIHTTYSIEGSTNHRYLFKDKDSLDKAYAYIKGALGLGDEQLQRVEQPFEKAEYSPYN